MNRNHRPPSIPIVGSNCKVDDLRIFWEEKSPGSAGNVAIVRFAFHRPLGVR